MSKFRFKGRLQPPIGESEFWTPPPFEVCPDCGGYWIDVMLSKETCTTCNGNGTIPIYYTIQKWEELTGRKVPDDMPVWYLFCGYWYLGSAYYDEKTIMIIATEAGRPPKDWRPE